MPEGRSGCESSSSKRARSWVRRYGAHNVRLDLSKYRHCRQNYNPTWVACYLDTRKQLYPPISNLTFFSLFFTFSFLLSFCYFIFFYLFVLILLFYLFLLFLLFF